jgi:hypothetical protein
VLWRTVRAMSFAQFAPNPPTHLTNSRVVLVNGWEGGGETLIHRYAAVPHGVHQLAHPSMAQEMSGTLSCSLLFASPPKNQSKSERGRVGGSDAVDRLVAAMPRCDRVVGV